MKMATASAAAAPQERVAVNRPTMSPTRCERWRRPSEPSRDIRRTRKEKKGGFSIKRVQARRTLSSRDRRSRAQEARESRETLHDIYTPPRRTGLPLICVADVLVRPPRARDPKITHPIKMSRFASSEIERRDPAQTGKNRDLIDYHLSSGRFAHGEDIPNQPFVYEAGSGSASKSTIEEVSDLSGRR